MEKITPYDVLTKNDINGISAWITSYTEATPANLKNTLRAWDKNKRTLFKALGNQLRVSFPYTLKIDDADIVENLRNIYWPISLYNMRSFWKAGQGVEKIYNPFMIDFYEFIYSKGAKISQKDATAFSTLFFHCNVKNNIIETIATYENFDEAPAYYPAYTFTNLISNRTMTIKQGDKTCKAIQKLLKFYGYDRMELFDEWRDDVSHVVADKSLKGSLVISIHPIDFLQLSDNAANWSSCLSMREGGSYRYGTVSLMNSRNAAVVYFESSKKFNWNEFSFPNKTWRSVLIVTKDIIVADKNYPYQSKSLAIAAMDKMRELVKKFGWHYQYLNQPYLDLVHFYDNECVIAEDALPHRHSILLYSNCTMYNDMVEDHDTDCYCCRNYVKHSKRICFTGPMTCLRCGKELSDAKIFSCPQCRKDFFCEEEQHISQEKVKTVEILWLGCRWWKHDSNKLCTETTYKQLCKHCLINEYLYFPAYKAFIARKNFTEMKNSHPDLIKDIEWVLPKEWSGFNDFFQSQN